VLRELRIRNFAIIDSLEVEFEPGFNVLTGETGAGKSILIGALGLALGMKASDEMIRSGEEEATVEARFDLSAQPALTDHLAQLGLAGEGTDLLVRRVVSRSGRNKVFLNDRLSTLSTLKEVGNRIVDIHGQHEHQLLFNPEFHLHCFDRFAGTEGLRTLLADRLSFLYRKIGELEDLRRNEMEILRKKDLLAFQIREIENAGLSPGEEARLREEREVCRNAETILQNCRECCDALYDRDGSVAEQLASVQSLLTPLKPYHGEITAWLEALDRAVLEIRDLSDRVRALMGRTEADPDRLAALEDRIHQLKNLKKKYGGTEEEVLAHLEKIRKDLDGLEHLGETKGDLEKEIDALKRDVRTLALDLYGRRKTASGRFEKEVRDQLAELNMAKVAFEVHVDLAEDPDGFVEVEGKRVRVHPHGIGLTEFYFSPNPGEPRKPLARIASGGEISRVMLALKHVLGKAAQVPVMIFDEIDSGIGGKTADQVGKKLKHVAERNQVFCVTHLPQIAGKADWHFRISKGASKQKTHVSVERLDRDRRIEELARMAGGKKITPATLRHAEEMLEQSEVQ
jgi:DNA repair protein RecN (Recombination protein N)